MTGRSMMVVSWALQLIAAGILFQTLFFKFSAAEESVYIFSTLGIEPWGRWASGVAELAAVALLLIPGTAAYGALLSLAVITGALVSHTKLGIVVKDDGGLLFGLAVVVFMASLTILYIRRAELVTIGDRLSRQLSSQ